MTNNQRIVSALRGEMPDRVPYTAYEWMWDDRGQIESLIEQGFGPIRHVSTCRRAVPDVRWERETFEKDGHTWECQILQTPEGELESLSMDGWTQEYLVQKPEDYRVI